MTEYDEGGEVTEHSAVAVSCETFHIRAGIHSHARDVIIHVTRDLSHKQKMKSERQI